MTASSGGNGKKWWFVGPVMAVGGLVFGAGGTAYTMRDSIARQDKCIEILTNKVVATEVSQARIDERLKSIDAALADIKGMLRQQRP